MTTLHSKPAIFRSEPVPGIAQLTFDMPGKSANVLTRDMFDQLQSQLDEIESAAQNLRGLILCTAKPKIFFAGADLNLISESLDWPDEKIRDFCRHGQHIFARLSEFKFPSVAAIHGICVGGGLELALACDFRICSDARNTLLGLPEVKLGLIPGWFGTARTPRLIGLAEAIELVVTGRLVNSDEADSLLLVDDLVPHEDLFSACINLLETCDQVQLAARRKLVNSPIIASQITANSYESWKDKIEQNTRIHSFAPLVAAEHMIRSAQMNLADAGESEGIAMSKVWGSDSNRGLLHLFFVDERIKKNPSRSPITTAARTIKCVGIVGAGQMGSQLAKAFAKSGHDLVIYDANLETAQRLADQLADYKIKSSIKLRAAQKLQGLSKCDLIVESIVENTRIKRDVISRLEPHLANDAIIATNTSAIPVSDLLGALKLPGRMIGIHVCHPIEHRKLCELIPTEATDQETTATAIAIARSIRKFPLVVGDRPGFVVNRLLAPYLDQAVQLFSLGVDISEIEGAATDFGFEVGPLQFIDSIGIDTLFYAGIVFAEQLPHLVGRSRVLPHLIKAGRLGQKSGAGFFDYSTGVAKLDLELPEKISQAMLDPISTRLSPNEIQMSLLMPMLCEAIKLIEEGTVSDAAEIDFCTVHGAGFPAHKGGLMYWADQSDLNVWIAAIEKAALYRPALTVPDRLREMAGAKQSFYE